MFCNEPDAGTRKMFLWGIKENNGYNHFCTSDVYSISH